MESKLFKRILSLATVVFMVISMLPMVRNLAIEKGEPCPVDGQRETVTVDGKEMEVVTFDVSKTVKAMQALTEGKN